MILGPHNAPYSPPETPRERVKLSALMSRMVEAYSEMLPDGAIRFVDRIDPNITIIAGDDLMDLDDELEFALGVDDEQAEGAVTLEDVLALAKRYPGLRISFGF